MGIIGMILRRRKLDRRGKLDMMMLINVKLNEMDRMLSEHEKALKAIYDITIEIKKKIEDKQ